MILMLVELKIVNLLGKQLLPAEKERHHLAPPQQSIIKLIDLQRHMHTLYISSQPYTNLSS